VTIYATRVGLESSFVSYCKTDLELQVQNHLRDGSIPFGVNYREIPDQNYLQAILATREAYETSYIILCLAKAKATLTAAAKQ
jgi:hypothetical protein